MTKKSIFILFSAVVLFFGIYALGKLLFPLYFAMNYMDEKNPEYIQYVQDRISFGTPDVKTAQRCDTLFDRIDAFLADSTQYQVPDSIPLKSQISVGGAQKEVLIYFGYDTIEVYRVTFDCQGFNYIDNIYQASDSFSEINSTALDNSEKERIVRRLRKEILDKISWSFN